jgi:GntR family transcriptional regulator/MocR family aminotransferase
MHLVARPGPRLAVGDVEAARRAAGRGFATPPLSAHYLGPAAGQGLLLGYAATPEREMDAAAARLAAALAD